MIKYCLEKWDKNKTALEKEIRTNYKKYMTCKYIELVKAVVNFVLNDENNSYCSRWDEERIHEIDDGHYSGTLIYLIPTDNYEPSASDYLITFVEYGSCSGCDTLLHLQSWIDYDALNLTEKQIKEYMQLCRDIVTNMRKPFNIGWRYDERFDEVEFDE